MNWRSDFECYIIDRIGQEVICQVEACYTDGYDHGPKKVQILNTLKLSPYGAWQYFEEAAESLQAINYCLACPIN
jgi:hypothetical protein